MRTYIPILLAFTFVTLNASAGENIYSGKNNSGSIDVPGLNSIPEFQSIQLEGGLLFGIRLMPTITNLKYNDNGDGNFSATAKMGFGVGAMLGANINDHLGLQIEGIYSSLNQQLSQSDYKADVNLKYISMPIMLVLNTDYSKPVNFNLAVGPQLGLNVGSDLDVVDGGDSVRAQLAVKKSDFGFAYGAGLDFGLTGMKLSVGFRGVIGLININDDSGTLETGQYYILEKTKMKTYSFYIGLTFGG